MASTWWCQRCDCELHRKWRMFMIVHVDHDFLDIYIVFAATLLLELTKEIAVKKVTPSIPWKSVQLHLQYVMLIYAYSFFTCLLLFVVWGSHIIILPLMLGKTFSCAMWFDRRGFVVVYTGSPGVKSCVSGVSFGATSSQTYSALTWAFWLNISWDLGFGESLKKLMPN